MTVNESETAKAQSGASGSAEEELWLTYLNYDQRIQQAVRRLGALSTQNVDEFRGLLLKDRDRSKVKEYEAESIRRLQGEAFVGDEELQRTLIVLTAENPRFGEELKRLVAATGKPEHLDQAVTAIRSGKAGPAPQAPAVVKEPSKEIAKEPVKEPIKEVARQAAKEPAKATTTETVKEAAVKEAVVVPLRKERPTAPAPQAVLREAADETKSSGGMKRLAVVGAVVLVAGAALAFLVPGLIGGRKAPDKQIVAAAPAPAPARVIESSPAAAQPAAPAVDIAMPAQADKAASPPLRPASAQPDAPATGGPSPDVRSAPVVGSNYKVMRGDMLSDIALKVYHDASKFRLIQSANPGIRNSPDRILVDQVIFIPQDTGSVSP